MCIMFGVFHHFVFRVVAPVVYRHVNENDSICRSVTLCVGMSSVQLHMHMRSVANMKLHVILLDILVVVVASTNALQY
jgi:hypothetical protein